LNQKTPPFHSAATALYTERGPARSELDYRRNAGKAAPDGHEPQSIGDHIDGALSRVKGLGPQQRLAVHNEMVRLSKNIEYIHLVASQAHHLGPHSDQAAGGPMLEGQPL
jgi:hypothetical protein